MWLDMAKGLEALHQRQIIHRDLKVMRSVDGVKMTCRPMRCVGGDRGSAVP